MRPRLMVSALVVCFGAGWCSAATVQYEFVGSKSEVELKCGFALCDDTYSIEGTFGVDVNFETGVAEFVDINAQFVGDGVAGGRGLENIFDGLHGTVMDARTVGFSVPDLPGPTAFHLRMGNSRLKLAGGYDRRIVDGESIAIDALALAVDSAGIWTEGPTDATAIDALTAEVHANTHGLAFDLNSDGRVNQADRLVWIERVASTYVGDSTLDGEFNSADLVAVFQAGQYEDGVVGNSTWVTGDWNGDDEFNSGDLVLAFQQGGYDQGRRQTTSVVPEPSALVMFAWGLLVLVRGRILSSSHAS